MKLHLWSDEYIGPAGMSLSGQIFRIPSRLGKALCSIGLLLNAQDKKKLLRSCTFHRQSGFTRRLVSANKLRTCLVHSSIGIQAYPVPWTTQSATWRSKTVCAQMGARCCWNGARVLWSLRGSCPEIIFLDRESSTPEARALWGKAWPFEDEWGFFGKFW